MTSGETNLQSMLDSLSVRHRSGRFAFVCVNELPPSLAGVHALVSETEGYTLIVDCAVADANAWEFTFEGAWLTLEVHSALEAVGLTAAVSRVLADVGIPANMLAGFYHDHLLVPFSQAAQAISVIESLARK